MTSVSRLDDAGRAREVARMMAGEVAASDSVLAGAKELHRSGESERRKSVRGESESAKVMAKKFLIETYGCQMNVHDSERMAGLLSRRDSSPPTPTTTPTWWSSTRARSRKAEEKLYTQAWRPQGHARRLGHAPVVAVTGCVAQQEGARELSRSRLVDIVVGTQRLKMLPRWSSRRRRVGSRSSTSARHMTSRHFLSA